MVTTRARSGFTLIELTIAIVLLAIGLLALTGALAHALRVTTQARVAHTALREVDAVADSIAAEGVPAAGVRERPGFRLEWGPAACAPAACVRVSAALARDTISIVAAVRRSR